MFFRPDRIRRGAAALACLIMMGAAKPGGTDPKNPTCPANPDWSVHPAMKLTVAKAPDGKVLLAEGAIDEGLVSRLAKVLKDNPDIYEIRMRSPGGAATVGNEAGRLIRKQYPGMATRIPAGWTCFSACNFLFMGGTLRAVDPGGIFMVHMFTHVSDRAAVKEDIQDDADAAVDMIGDIEQSSAMLASDDNDFLIRMGVSRKLLTEVMYQQKAVAGKGRDQSTRRCLTQAEVRKYNVANTE
jgi:hypothetical protein